jgi:hypothetical protein
MCCCSQYSVAKKSISFLQRYIAKGWNRVRYEQRRGHSRAVCCSVERGMVTCNVSNARRLHALVV